LNVYSKNQKVKLGRAWKLTFRLGNCASLSRTAGRKCRIARLGESSSEYRRAEHRFRIRVAEKSWLRQPQWRQGLDLVLWGLGFCQGFPVQGFYFMCLY